MAWDDDSLLQASGCVEFSGGRAIYGLFREEAGPYARWRRVHPVFNLSLMRHKGCSDDGKDLLVGLEPSVGDPIYYAIRGSDRPEDPASDPLHPKDSAEVPKTVIRELPTLEPQWFSRIWSETGYAWWNTGETEGKVVAQTFRLQARTPDGAEIHVGEREGTGGYQYWYPWIVLHAVSDLDADGRPELHLKLDDYSMIIVPIAEHTMGNAFPLLPGVERSTSGC